MSSCDNLFFVWQLTKLAIIIGTLAFSNSNVLENKSSRVVMQANAPMKDHADIRHCGSLVGRGPEPSKNRRPTDLTISIMIRYNKQNKIKKLIHSSCLSTVEKKKEFVQSELFPRYYKPQRSVIVLLRLKKMFIYMSYVEVDL
jgi:hypothetical protein